MPKFYRFRALTPSPKPKRGKDKEKDLEKLKSCKNCLTLAYMPAPTCLWYQRRTAWRQAPLLQGLPRQLSEALRSSLPTNLTNLPLLVLKMPATS